jgi:hypothetical protein
LTPRITKEKLRRRRRRRRRRPIKGVDVQTNS